MNWLGVFSKKQFIKTKIACCDENNEFKRDATFCSKGNRKKTCFRWSPFMLDYISAYRSQIAFMGLDFESDKPRMEAELRVMMPEL